RRTGHEIHKHFGSRLIEAEERHLLACGDHQAGNAERAEAVIVLRDVRQLENRRTHDGPAMRLFTSSTTREDAARASTSIFAAARLHAIAPYASIPCTIGGRTPVSTLAPRIAVTIVAAIANVP